MTHASLFSCLFRLSAFLSGTFFGVHIPTYHAQITKGYTRGAVTQNVGEKGVNSVLDYVSSSNDWNLLKGFYEQTLDTLRQALCCALTMCL